MTNEIITVIIAMIGGGGTFWGLVKSGLIKIQIGQNGNGYEAKAYEKRIVELESHAKIANDEMSDVKENLVSLNTKMDIIMRHFKI